MKGAKGLISTAAAAALCALMLLGCEITSSTHDCGNGECESGETCATCPQDCGACPSVCGNGECESDESCSTCPADCGECPSECGDGTCDADENCETCPADCGECPSECGDGTCDADEDCETCPADCGECPTDCGDGTCDPSIGETCETCPEDCGECPTGAAVSVTWYIHGVLGGADIGWGSGALEDDSCEWVATMIELADPPVVQLWEDTDGDDVADERVDFTCADGEGTSDFFWDDGDTLKYAFALVAADDTLLSLSWNWETATLAEGINDLGEVNFYIGDYGPLDVELQWADEMADPAFGGCDFPDSSVSTMGYLLCWQEDCDGWVYDEVDIDLDPIECRTELAWDIIDFATYTLILDGEDVYGTTVWGSECQDLEVDEMEPASNEFVCLVLMTEAP